MNANCFKTVFSERMGCLVAVGEHACSQGKSSGESAFGEAAFVASVLALAGVFIGALVLSQVFVGLAWAQPAANALPTGGAVVQGAASMAQSANQLNITQASQRAAINWQSFDIGSSAKVNVVQPNAQAVLLNRVLGQSPSQIFGQLQANGHVILVNPNGVLFGKDGSVNAGSFTASTLGISDADFMAGNMVYQRNGSTAGVVNQGTIGVSPGGYVALLGASVSNEGKIIAPKGGVALGSAETIKVPLSGSGRIKLELTASDINASVKNSGSIVSEGGQVYMQALALNRAAAQVIQSGSIDTTGEQGGAVHLLADGGTIKVDGSIKANSTGTDDKGQVRKGGDIVIGRDEETGALAGATNVSGAQLESNKGFVETSGDWLATYGTRVLAKDWLLDPTNITIAASGATGTAYSSNYTAGADSVILASDINASLNAGTGVTIATSSSGASAGNIAVNENIAKTVGASAYLTLRAHGDITVASNKTITSTSGNLSVTLNSDFDANGAGVIVMNSGSGITSNGGNIALGGGSAGSAASYAAGYASALTGVSLTASSLNAGGGNISIKGKGTTVFTNTSSMSGVNLNAATISTSGVGTITIDGVGGNGNVSNLNVGIGMTNSATITGGAGAITLTGTTSTTAGGYYNSGIWVYGNGSTVTGAGAISLTGTGGGSTYGSLNQGVRLEGGRVTATGTGTVTVVGTPGAISGTAGPNAGVEISGGGYVQTNGGSISITGNSGSAGLTGVLLQSSGSSVTSSGGSITFTTDSYSGDNSATINAGSGTVTIQNNTSTTTVNVGGTATDTLTGTLGLDVSSTELGKITAGKIVVGRRDATGSGAVTVSALNMGAMGNTGGDLSVLSKTNIAVNDSITKTAGTDATLSLLANGNITLATNKTITASTGKLNVLLNSDSDATSGGAIVFNTGSGITSNGGNITLGGGTALDGTGFAVADGVSSLQGVSLNTAAITAGGGNIVMNGKTAATNYVGSLSNISGVYMSGGSISTTGSGTINLTGNNQNTDTQSQGFVLSSGTITGGSTGAVTITGDSRGVTSSSFTYVRGALVNGTVTSTGGNIGITGYGGAGVQYDYGVDVSGSVTTTAAGAVNITGTAGAGASGGNVGVNTSGAGNISSVDGAISITGTGGIGNGSQIRDHGVFVGGSNAIRSTGTGNITVTGTATNTDNGYSQGVVINAGGLNANSGTIKIDGTVPQNYQVADYINAPITSTSGNVYIRSASANIQNTATGTISGNNVSIDNTGGTIDVNGVITKGAGGASTWNGVISQKGVDIQGTITAANNLNIYGNQTGSDTGISVGAGLTATGNVNIFGNVAAATSTGVNLTSAGSITSSGTAATINIGSNYSIANAAAIKATGTTGTGANINLTATGGTITGAGAIGDTTNKNASVTFTQAGTSTYSGAINAANFTKAGAGSLTLESWIATPAVATNVSNAYTVNAGSLTLAPGGTYAQLNPTSVNVVNASTFAISNASNGWWKNTAFKFTGGLGGGTMNLGGNPIGASGTTNTFSTSGGATNTITGLLNANSATVNMNLTSATSGTTLLDSSFAALAFTQNSQGGFGLQNGGTVNVAGGGSLLFKDKFGATNLNINAGVVQMGDGSAATTAATADLGATNVAIASGAKLIFNRAEAYSNASIVSGSGSLIQAGSATLTLTGNSSAFAGATTVNAGKALAIGTGGSLGAAGSTLTLTDASSNLSFTNTSGVSTVASTISGAGTVTENGAGGSGLLLANNTYTGTTTTTAGTLQVGNGGAVGSLGTGSVVDNSALVVKRSDDITISNAISGSGTFTQAGTGKILFANNNAGYTGQTFVDAGILSFGTPSTSGTAATQYWSSQFNIAAGAVLDFNSPIVVTLNNSGTTFTGAGTITKTGAGGLTWNSTDTTFNMLSGSLIDVKEGTFVGSASYHGKWTNNLSSLNVASGASFQGVEGDTRIDALTGAGSVSFGWSTLGSLTVGVNNTAAGAYNTTAGTATFSGALSGPAPLNKIGTGTQILTGANTYTGATTISAGTLQIGDGGTTGTLGTGAVTDNASLVFNRSNSLTVANAISGTGTLNQNGSGTTVLTATNTYSGTTTINAGTLQIGSGGTAGTLGTGAVVDNGILAIHRSDEVSLTQAISGAGSVLQMGTGTTKLVSNANTFTGGITISKGAVMIGNGGGTNGNYNLNSGTGTITLGDSNTGSSNVALQIESGTGLGQTMLNNSIVVSSSGTGTATIGSVVGSGSGTYTEVRSSLTLNRDVILNDGTTDRLGYSGTITGTGNVSITGNRVSMGTPNANGISSNNFVGNLTIASGSILQAGSKSLFPTTTNVINNGTLRLLDGNYQAINALSGTGTIETLNISGGLLTNLSIGNNNGGATFSGTITGSNPVLSLTKNGTGTQILTGANTYTGATTINAGTLQIGNGGSAGTLGVNGTVYSAVSVAANANLDFYRTDIGLNIPNAISGAGVVNFKGTGVSSQSSYTLTGNNSGLSGNINVSSSRISINSANQVGTAAITVNSGAALYANGGFTLNNALSLAGNGWLENTYGQLGALRLQNGTNYAGAITLAADARIGAYNSTGTVSGVISGSKNLEFNSNTGTVTLTGNNTYSGTTAISGGTVQVGNAGTTGTLGVGDVTLSNSSNLNYVRSAATSIANNISGTGSVAATITGASSTLTVDHTINLTGGTVNLVTDGNLSVTQTINTSNATASAVFLESGKATAAGMATGGDVTLSGSGAVTVGSGGRITYMTGSVAGSTGLGVPAGNNRYKSDETTTSYTTALGAGSYAIYREAPTLTATFNNATKTYNGLSYSGGNGVVLTGFANGDTDAKLGTINYSGTSQTAINVGDYAISGSAVSGVGYSLAYTAGTLTVNKANLVLSGTRVYDGGKTFAGQYLTAAGVNNEAFAVTGLGDATNLSSKNVQTNQTLNSVTGLAVGASNGTNTGLSSNYNALSTASSSVSVSVKAATVTGTATNLTYNGSLQNQQVATSNGFVSGDAVSITGLASGKNAATYTSNLSVTGADANNYNVTYTNADLVIGKANLVLSGTREYDAGKTFAGQYLTATGVAGESFAITGTGDVSNLSTKNVQTNQALSSLTGLSLGASNGSNAGSSSNYNAISTTGSSVSVTAKAATVDATPTTVTYNGAAQTQTAPTTSGFIVEDVITVSGVASGQNAGTYASSLAVAGVDAGNYNVTFNNANLLIQKAALTATGNSSSVTYSGGNQSVAGFTVSGLQGSDTASSLNNITASGASGTNAGSYTNTVTAGLEKNYTVSTVNGALQIAKAALTATGNSSTVTYNGGNQSIAGFTVSGLQGSDTTNNLSSIAASGATGKNVGSYTNTVTAGTETNYTVTTVNGALQIDKANLIATGNSGSVTYNGANQSVSGFAVSGLLGSDSVSSLSSIVASGATGKNVGSYTNTVTAGTEANYNVSTVNGSLQIGKANLILSGTREYDAGKTFAGTHLTATGVAGETFALTGAGDASNLSSKNVQTNQLLSSVTGLSLGTSANGGLSTNYNAISTTGSSVSVTAKAATVTGTATNVTYNGSSQTQSAAASTGFIAGDVISITGEASGKNAGTYTSSLAVSGADAGNYNVTVSNADLVIAKAALTVTASQVSKTYDGGLGATGTGTVGTLAGAAAGDVVNNAGAQAYLDANAGTGKTVRASGLTIKDASNADMTGNYTISYVDNTTSTISKAALTVTANADARFVTQTDAAGFNGVSYAGFVGGENSSVLGGSLAISRTNAPGTQGAGVYSGVLEASGLTSGNYDIRYTNGNYTIVPANQLLIKTVNNSVTYGGAPVFNTTAQYLLDDGVHPSQVVTLSRSGSNGSYSFSDGVGGSVSMVLKPYVTNSATAAAVSSSSHTVVGNYDIKDASPTVVGSNFVGAPVFVGALTVDTKAVTPSATGVSKVYDASTSMSNVVVGLSGQVGSDNLTISGTGAFSQKNVGTGLGYTVSGITLNGSDAANYHLAGGNTSLSGHDGVITAAELKLTTSNVTKIYDRSLSALGTAQATQGTQLFGSDTLSGGAFAFTNGNAGNGNKVVTVSGVTVNDGNNGANYNVSYVDNTTSTITPKNLTANYTAISKTYNGSMAATVTGSSSDVISGDTVNLFNTSANFGSKDVGVSKTVTVSGIGISGADSGNYALQNTTASTTADISAKNLTARFSAATRAYNGGVVASVTGSSSDIVGSDVVTFSTTSASFDTKDAGIGKVVSVAGIGLGGADAGNYILQNTSVSTTGAITKKDVSITSLTADHKVYDGSRVAVISAGAVSTGVGSETLLLSGSGTFSGKNAGTGKTVTVADVTTLTKSDGTGDWRNYNLVNTGGMTTTADIAQAALTVTASAVTKTYDGTLAASGAGTAGALAGAGDVVGSAGSQVFLDKNAGTGKTVRASGVTIKDASNADMTGNYAITYVDNTTSVIQQAALELTTANVVKTYDGLLGANGTAAVKTGTLFAGDSLTSGTFAFTDKNTGVGNKTVTVAGVTVGDGTHNGNYAVTYAANTTSTIHKAALTVTANGVTKTYDGTLSATGSGTAGVLAGAGDLVNSAGSQAFLDKNAGTGKTVRASGVTIKDASNADMTGNYTISYVDNTTSTINKAQLSAALVGPIQKEYDGTTATATDLTPAHYALTGWATVGGVSEGASVGQKVAAYANANVANNQGAGSVTASLQATDFTANAGTDLGNYQLPMSASGNVGLITRAALTVKVNNTAMFVTQDPNTAFDQGFSFTGLKNGESGASVLGALTRSYAGAANPATGSYASVYGLATAPVAANYNVTVQNGDLTVVAADKLLINVGGKSETYGALTASNAGASANTVVAQYCLVSTDCNGANLANLAMSRQGSLWTATDVSNSTISFNTVVDTAGRISGGGYLNAGSYTYATEGLTTSGVVNFNGIVLSGGVLSVDAKRLTLSASNVSKVYDGTVALAGMALTPSGVLAGDSVGVTSSGGTFSSKNAGSQAFSLTGLQLQGSDLANYVFAGNSLSGTGTITPKTLLVTASALDKTYDGTTAATGSLSTANVIGQDDVRLSWGPVAFASKDVSRDAQGQVQAQSVNFAGVQLSGLDAGNYSVNSTALSSAKITPKLLSVSGTVVANKPQDGNTQASAQAGSLSGLVGSEQLQLQAQASFDTPLPGSNKPVTVRYRLANGANGGLGGNYELPAQVLSASILARSGGNAVQPLRVPVVTVKPGTVNSGTGAAIGTLRNTESGDVCSSATPEKCQCHATSVAGMEICTPGLLKPEPATPERGRMFVQAKGP
ncbi:YDG domain-containing protein [Limnohabitans sp. T6-20]|uniref:YDG domain-containing protein n=1 Tax=Limnohabitans sp. T6-20 TaxID=1100725 RepID=UPI000D35AB5F|nr:YDG domain-containing protein [Limnohabitans sp. T6-20]PUE10299.1 hypothetical protein B9Z33_09420 [Limnohabitans sp. T6-20]